MAAILDAAEALLTEAGGEEALTLTVVAARAGTATGSVYQFFSGKEAIPAAFVGRLAGPLRDAPARLFSLAALAGLPVPELATSLVESAAQMAGAHPAFVHLAGRALAAYLTGRLAHKRGPVPVSRL